MKAQERKKIYFKIKIKTKPSYFFRIKTCSKKMLFSMDAPDIPDFLCEFFGQIPDIAAGYLRNKQLGLLKHES